MIENQQTMLEKIKQLINRSVHKEMAWVNIVSQLGTRSVDCTIRQDIDEAIRDGFLKFRYVKGEKYISVVEPHE